MGDAVLVGEVGVGQGQGLGEAEARAVEEGEEGPVPEAHPGGAVLVGRLEEAGHLGRGEVDREPPGELGPLDPLGGVLEEGEALHLGQVAEELP